MVFRRGFLATAAGIGTLAGAGCLGIGGSGPESTLKSFFEAVDAGKIEEANTHYTGTVGLKMFAEQRNIAIRTIENHSNEELAEYFSTQGHDVDGEKLATTLAESIGGSSEEWTLVYYNIINNGEQLEDYAFMVNVDGDWKISILTSLRLMKRVITPAASIDVDPERGQIRYTVEDSRNTAELIIELEGSEITDQDGNLTPESGSSVVLNYSDLDANTGDRIDVIAVSSAGMRRTVHTYTIPSTADTAQ